MKDFEDWYCMEGWKYVPNRIVGYKIWLAFKKQD
jgi:hypothetical protein